MKKLFILFLVVFLLFSCSSKEKISNKSWLELFSNENFSILVPSKWRKIENNDKILPKPKFWNIELAMTANEVRYGFSNNMLILSQNLNKMITSKSFSILNNVWSTKEFLEYTELDKQNIKLDSQDESIAYIFEAKYNASTPKLKYFQMWVVCDYKKAYLITIAISTDIKDNSWYLEILKSFKCKKWNQ